MRRSDASMPPMTMGTSLNASRARWAYTTTDRSGRLPPCPPGVYASSLRMRLSDVYRFTMESMLPAVMPKNRFGRPNCLKGSALCQSGCAMMPTRKPCASSNRPMMAMPKLGWST